MKNKLYLTIIGIFIISGVMMGCQNNVFGFHNIELTVKNELDKSVKFTFYSTGEDRPVTLDDKTYDNNKDKGSFTLSSNSSKTLKGHWWSWSPTDFRTIKIKAEAEDGGFLVLEYTYGEVSVMFHGEDVEGSATIGYPINNGFRGKDFNLKK